MIEIKTQQDNSEKRQGHIKDNHVLTHKYTKTLHAIEHDKIKINTDTAQKSCHFI